jgi:PPM family protein phosphatase
VTFAWESAALSDRGRRRSRNEDAFFVREAAGVFLVADGMGGHAAGHVASEIAARMVGTRLEEMAGSEDDSLESAALEGFQRAHQALEAFAEARPRARGLGTTVTGCLIRPDGSYGIVHLGDSRIYLLRQGILELVTRDHTWVQREIDAGRLDESAGREHPFGHVLVRVLSEDTPWEPDIVTGQLQAEDVLLLCTDGLCSVLADEEITDVLEQNRDVTSAASALVRRVNKGGGPDNVTVVLVRLTSVV